MGCVERATHTHCPHEGRGWYAHYDLGNRCGEKRVPVTRGGCARARGAHPTREASAGIGYGGEPAGLCDREGGVRECAALGASM
jgi:hypothetical protein